MSSSIHSKIASPLDIYEYSEHPRRFQNQRKGLKVTLLQTDQVDSQKLSEVDQFRVGLQNLRIWHEEEKSKKDIIEEIKLTHQFYDQTTFCDNEIKF